MRTRQRKCIYIIGPQCTGKTTLVNALRNHLSSVFDCNGCEPPEIITEVARTVMDQVSIRRDEISSSQERCITLQKAIFNAQYHAETRLIGQNHWYISDRSGLDPLVYARLFAGDSGAREIMESSQWRALKQNMKTGLVFLCESGCRWLVDDGVRLMPKDQQEWQQIDREFRGLLEENEIQYSVIGKDSSVVDRVSLVLAAICAS